MNAIAALLLLALLPAAATAKTIRLVSLEWPPYAGASLPGGGTSIEALRAAARIEGAELDVRFLPWSRVLAHAESGRDGVVGFVPEYRSRGGEDRWWFSRPIGDSPVGFVERSDRPVPWRTLADLRGKRIGVVRGYVNEEAFDRQVAEGRLTVEAVNDDLANLRKLRAGRLDLAVIDPRVLAHLLDRHPELRAPGPVLRMNPRLLTVHTLHAAFRRSPEGEAARAQIDRGLLRLQDGAPGEEPRTPTGPAVPEAPGTADR